MDPFTISSIVSGAGGLLGSLFSSKASERQLQAQRQENALNRQFNAEQSQLARDYNTEMFHMTNEYNDPRNVVNRLVRAGLNPNLAMSGGSLAGTASMQSSPSSSSSGSVSPSLPDFSGLQSPGRAMLDAELARAQIESINADTDLKKKDLSWKDRLNSAQERLSGAYSDLNLNLSVESQKRAFNIEASTDKLLTETSNLKTLGKISEQQLRISMSEAHISEVRAQYASTRELAEIDEILSSADLNKTQIIRFSTLLAYEVSESASRASVNNATSESISFQNCVNRALEALKGFGGIADYQLQSIEATISQLLSSADSSKRNASTNERNSETASDSVFLNFISSLISVGTRSLTSK